MTSMTTRRLRPRVRRHSRCVATLHLASSVCGLFKWRQFEPEVILLAAGWYLRFSLSYRDVEELLAERGLHADHVTIWRWVQRYAPEME
jgi:transposase-like protein